MATRIYQGRILSAEFENPENNFLRDTPSAIDSLVYTFTIFQDAINYHLTALAGMIDPGINPESTLGKFRDQVKAIWNQHPRDNSQAQTLQQSVTKTLNLPPQTSFNDAIDAIYGETHRRELLPYVLQYIIESTSSGEGAIQKEGRSLLPKLCDINFSGNFDYTIKEKKAAACKIHLQRELAREDITTEELTKLAEEMDLSWAGIKTQPNSDYSDSEKFDFEESLNKIHETMDEFCLTLKQKRDAGWNKLAEELHINLYEEVTRELRDRQLTIGEHYLAKNNKAAAELKQAAIFFMYYPSKLSAQLLLKKLGKEKKAKIIDTPYDCSTLENDPLLLCRGTRGYIYKGFSALPDWETANDEMYSNEWDILAFKEALKTLHSFELKTEERNNHIANLEKELLYMETGKGASFAIDEEEDSPRPVLGGDPRFELLKALVKEIAPENYTDYTISSRALQGYKEIRHDWLKLPAHQRGNEMVLQEIARKHQKDSVRFGSSILFDALCKKKYHMIWQEWTDEASTLPRSCNILSDFNRYQELKQEIEQYREPVKITAAEPTVSPRQLLFSDLNNFGPKSKGHEFIKGKKGFVRLRTIIRNNKGHLEATNNIVRYSAPRFERDELGTDSACWTADKKSTTDLTSWLQPMMKALKLDPAKLHMEKEPALGLQVKHYPENSHKRPKSPASVCLLNFPVNFNFEHIHAQIGKAAIWNRQMLGGADEKQHLHWPSTYTGKASPWWESKQIQKEGFQVLGIDLGVRIAAAWALTDIQQTPELKTAKGTVLTGRLVGHDGTRNWYGFCTKNGTIRIDGEGKTLYRDPDKAQEPDGIGYPTPEDLELSRYIFELAGLSSNPEWNILVLGNEAIKAFRKLLSRCRIFQSLLVKLKDEQQSDKAFTEAQNYFSHNAPKKQLLPGILKHISNRDASQTCALLLAGLLELRSQLPSAAEKLTNLLLPRKHGEWVWQPKSRPGYICSGRMIIGNKETPMRRIFHRGGLSIKRLSQIEDLRRLLQSMNRLLHETPGVRAEFGSRLKDVRVVDPCPDILRKIENIREQRVNKIAHEITALALGLQLKAPRKDKNANHRDIIHGEYEIIPNRKPVDFVVLENLSRYRTSIDRTPSENSTLMRWAHRQIVSKVKQLLEEVFGIPILCAHAAYTSKFDSLTSAPGFRAVEMTNWRLHELLTSTNNNERRLGEIYADYLKRFINKRDSIKLLMPTEANNGDFFICNKSDGVCARNADINAALNIAWRGLAAPESLHLLHRVRINRKKGKITPVYSNKREKSLQKLWTFELLKEIQTDNGFASTFWTDEQTMVTPEARYTPAASRIPCTLTHGKTLWGFVKSQRWNLCHQYNIRILKKIGIDTTYLENFLKKTPLLQEDDSELPL